VSFELESEREARGSKFDVIRQRVLYPRSNRSEAPRSKCSSETRRWANDDRSDRIGAQL